MRIALDPYMHRHLSLAEVAQLAAELGYEYIELSPRPDFLAFWVQPRAHRERVNEFKSALRANGVKVASLMGIYHWASPNEEERQAAVRYWKRAIAVASELECPAMNSEFTRGPSTHVVGCCCGGGHSEASEAAFWKSMDELVPVFEEEGITLHLEPHPEDFVEDGNTGVDMVRMIGSKNVKYLYCAPHTYHMGGDMEGMLRYAAPVLGHVHVADTLDHRASSGNRFIVNPPGAKVTVHQHLNIGEGELDWDVFFKTLADIGFDGIMTACVLAWEEKAVESSRFMREKIGRYVEKFFVNRSS